MKKFLALLLVCLTVLPMLVACQDSGNQPSVTTDGSSKGPDVTTDPWDDGVPKGLDYKEREFTFSVPGSGDMWGELSYDREEDTGDTICSAIYNRNQMIQERFNLSDIVTVTYGSTGSQAAEFQQFAVSGTDVIDIIATGFYQSGKPLITSDYVLPWNDIKYINLDKMWWNKSVTETLGILGNYYYIVGDVNWFTMSEVSVCYFNKVVADANKAVVGDLYQAVRDNKWTFDYTHNMAKQMSRDNGDGKWDDQDTYGAIQNTIIGVTGFVYGSNYQTVVMNNETGPKLQINTAKMNNIIKKLVAFCKEDNTSFTETFDYAHQSKGIPIFFDNRALFYFDILMHAEGFRDEESDFGILPYPKYDEKQKQYVSYANQWGLACALPFTCQDTSRTGAILEAMSCLSNKMIVPAYYEKTLMGKVKRDDESEEMLNIIFGNILYDFGICYCTDLSFILPKTAVEQKLTGVASWYKRNEKKLYTNYWELYEHVYEKINGVKPELPADAPIK